MHLEYDSSRAQIVVEICLRIVPKSDLIIHHSKDSG